MQESPSLTEQLRHFAGDRVVADAVLQKILPELHRVATRELGRRNSGSVLSPTELINEAWLRNLRKGGWKINDREHFYAIAALAMRQVLVEIARARAAQRRGNGDSPESWSRAAEVAAVDPHDPQTLVEIGILMEQLELKDPLAARVVDLHYFAGFTLEEAAEITGLTFRQVRHRWEKGCNYLKDRLRRENSRGPIVATLPKNDAG